MVENKASTTWQPHAAGVASVAQELGRIPIHNELTVNLRNNRLEITAQVDRDGLGELIAMLGHYQEILGHVTTWNKGK